MFGHAPYCPECFPISKILLTHADEFLKKKSVIYSRLALAIFNGGVMRT
jgi:hypothetical protein